MGDRANIQLTESDGNHIYLYTHWCGEAWPSLLKKAMLLGKERWDDPSYLNRFIITEMCSKADGCTGYGVSVRKGDNEHPVYQVDHKSQRVRKKSHALWFDEGDTWEKNAEVLFEWSFEDFVKADLADL